MTTSNRIRILKAQDVAHHAIVTLPRPASPGVPQEDAPVESRRVGDGEIEILVEQARAEGAASAASALEPALRRLEVGLAGIAQQDAEARALAIRLDSEEIVETALAVTRWILDGELRDPEALLALARRARAGVGDPDATRIRVHPQLIDPVSELAPVELAIVGDEDLAPGEFVVETTGPDVAMRFDRALDRARQALLEDGDGS